MRVLRSVRSPAFAIALVGFAGLVIPSVSRGDTIYTLNSPDSALGVAPGPYGTVKVHLDSSTQATVTFLANSLRKFGGAQALDVNTNGAATASNFNSNGIGHAAAMSGGGPGSASGFGSFSNSISNYVTLAYAFTQASFVLTKTSGTWASDGAVLTSNADGFVAAAYVFVVGSDGSSLVTKGFTGNGPLATPEFGSASLMGLLLLGLGGIFGVRRFRMPAVA
jgi:hypothetical protein